MHIPIGKCLSLLQNPFRSELNWRYICCPFRSELNWIELKIHILAKACLDGRVTGIVAPFLMLKWLGESKLDQTCLRFQRLETQLTSLLSPRRSRKSFNAYVLVHRLILRISDSAFGASAFCLMIPVLYLLISIATIGEVALSASWICWSVDETCEFRFRHWPRRLRGAICCSSYSRT